MPLAIDPDTAWNGITSLYAAPEIHRRLLRRQDEEGLDIVLHLFVRWAAAQGHDLDEAALAQAESLVAPWRAEVIAPLRALRRSMKAVAVGPASREAVRDKVKVAELAAERAQLEMLCAWLQAR